MVLIKNRVQEGMYTSGTCFWFSCDVFDNYEEEDVKDGDAGDVLFFPFN